MLYRQYQCMATLFLTAWEVLAVLGPERGDPATLLRSLDRQLPSRHQKPQARTVSAVSLQKRAPGSGFKPMDFTDCSTRGELGGHPVKSDLLFFHSRQGRPKALNATSRVTC